MVGVRMHSKTAVGLMERGRDGLCVGIEGHGCKKQRMRALRRGETEADAFGTLGRARMSVWRRWGEESWLQRRGASK